MHVKEILGHPSVGGHTHWLGLCFTLGDRGWTGLVKNRVPAGSRMSCRGKGANRTGSHPRPDMRWGQLLSHVPGTVCSPGLRLGYKAGQRPAAPYVPWSSGLGHPVLSAPPG